MSEDPFSLLMASADPALVVVTTSAQNHRAGCLVGFHSQSSITPEHYCVWLSKANHTYRVALRAHRFGVHFLTSDDLALAERFGTRSGEDVDKFAGLEVDLHDDIPLLRSCPNRMLVERITLLDDGSDHVCLTSLVLDSWTDGSFRPLRVSDAAGLEPGHASEERAIRP
ncbi:MULTISPECIES: flavin reductase family protein [unclassified Nocardioides]|uniref:flavin reductase family protein n=1 Tax=unclassified Nocardioides TaxID=2615069 RepID=UPI0011529D69|nr:MULTISPECIES: flavin reductase [unclassified Nocardioides]TQK69683.1 flavin reductase (DIM6/NTAB) family NADH-FMN oxidoreductase RutF [Nocardioides sp. SLBN-35]WGY01082.1 flavin reductase [Nocardioides sp. QY071]